MYKKILITIVLLIPNLSYGAFGVGWNATSTTQGWVSPNLVSAVIQTVAGKNFVATSSMATSTFAGDVGVNYIYSGPYLYSGAYPQFAGTFLPNYMADFTLDIDSFAAIQITNPNAGTQASTDITFQNNLTADYDSDGYYSYISDIGFTSSNSNVPYYGLQNIPNLAYWFNTDGPISLAAATSSTAGFIQFLTGGFNQEAARITSTGALGIGSTSPHARLAVTNPLSTNTVLFEDQTSPDLSPFMIDGNGNVGVGTTTTASAKIKIAPSSDTTSGLTIQGATTHRGNLFEVATSTGDAKLFFSPLRGTALNSDNGYLALKPGNRNYEITTHDGAGAMRFGRSDAAAALSFVPGANVSMGASAGTFIMQGSGATVNGIVLSPYDSGGTGVMQIGRRFSDSNVAVGATVEFWPNSAQTLPVIQVMNPGGVGNTAVMMRDGRVGAGTSTPYAQLSASSTLMMTAVFDQRSTFDILNLNSSGVRKVVVNSIGSVGIGTTTPYAILSVVGDTGIVAERYHATSTTATSTFSGPIKLGSTGGSPTVGNVALVGGTITVTTGAATSGGYLHLTRKTSGGTIGTAITYTITNGSFTVTSDSVLDTSTFTWFVTQ